MSINLKIKQAFAGVVVFGVAVTVADDMSKASICDSRRIRSLLSTCIAVATNTIAPFTYSTEGACRCAGD